MSIFLVDVGVNETDLTAQLFDGDVSVGLVTKLVAIMIANILLGKVITLFGSITEARTKRNVRQSVWDKLLSVPMSYFKNENPQDAITRIVNNSTAVSNAITLVVIPFATSAYAIYACVAQVANYDVRLAITLFCTLPLVVLMAFITGRMKFSVTHQYTNVLAALTTKLSELIRNIPVAKVFVRK